jgi:glucose-6-phosphate dehydrogenase assembly protein OpcA
MPAQLEDAAISQVEHELAQLRDQTTEPDQTPDLRMSTMTHLAWAPEEWYERAISTLHGMGERHPSRTIVLVPQPDAGESRIDAELDLERYPLENVGRQVCAEVVILTLKGERAQAPASIVRPLLIADLPVFLRWRGEPPWGTPPLEQLVDLVDRLVVNSAEWDDLPYAYGKLVKLFDRTTISDLAWARSLGWRRSIAQLWPAIADATKLHVRGPLASALLLQGWLHARLGTEIDLQHTPTGEEIESISIDGEEVAQPYGELPTQSELLADELDHYSRDPVYEQAVTATIR